MEGKTVLWQFLHLGYMYPVKATFLFGVNQGPLMKYEVLGKRNSREGQDTPGNFLVVVCGSALQTLRSKHVIVW